MNKKKPTNNSTYPKDGVWHYSELTMITRISISFFIGLSLVSCSGGSINIDEPDEHSLSQTNHENGVTTYNQSKPDSLTKVISDVATSFHQWYIETLNRQNNTTPTGAYIVKGQNGKCKLENKLYFAELRKLGTISEKFIQSEDKRTRTCADYMSAINWNDYKNSDAYKYSEYCPELDYDYWTKSQEVFNGVIVDQIKELDSKWEVTLAFCYDPEKKSIERINQPVVTVEQEGNRWLITKIDWLNDR